MATDAGGSQDDNEGKKKKQKKSERQPPPSDLTKPGTPISSRYYPSRAPPEPVTTSDSDLAAIIRRLRTSQYQNIKSYQPESEESEKEQPSTSAPRSAAVEPRQSSKIESRAEDINAMLPSEQITQTSKGRVFSADSKPIFNSKSDSVGQGVFSRSNATSISNISESTDDSAEYFLIHDSDGEVLMAVDDNFDSSLDSFHSSSDHGMNYDSTKTVISSASENAIPVKSVSAEVLKENKYVTSAEQKLSVDDILNDQASRVLYQSTSQQNPSEVMLSDLDFYKLNAKTESEESVLTPSESYVVTESGTIVNMDDIEPEKPNALRLSSINITKIDEQQRKSINSNPRTSTNEPAASSSKNSAINVPKNDVYFSTIEQVSPGTLRAFNRSLIKHLEDEEKKRKSSFEDLPSPIPFPAVKAKPEKLLPETVIKSLHDRESSIPSSTEDVNQIRRVKSYYKDLNILPQASNQMKSEDELPNSDSDANEGSKARNTADDGANQISGGRSDYEDFIKSDLVSKRETAPQDFENDKPIVSEPTPTDLALPDTPINSKKLKRDPATGRYYYDIKHDVPLLPSTSPSHDRVKEQEREKFEFPSPAVLGASVNSKNLMGNDETGENYYADVPKSEVPLKAPEQPNEIAERTIHPLALTPGTPVSSKNLKKNNETGEYYYDLRATPGEPLPEPPRPIKMTDGYEDESHPQMKPHHKPYLDILGARINSQMGSTEGILESEKSVLFDIPNVVEYSSENQTLPNEITEESVDEPHPNQQQCFQLLGMQAVNIAKEIKLLNSSYNSLEQPIPRNAVENGPQSEQRKKMKVFPEIMKPGTPVNSKNFQQDEATGEYHYKANDIQSISKVPPTAEMEDSMEEIKISLIKVPGTPVTSKNLRKDNVTGEYYYISKKPGTTAVPAIPPPFETVSFESSIVSQISDGSKDTDSPIESMTPIGSKSFTDAGVNPITPVPSNVLQFEDIGTNPMTPIIKSAVNVADEASDPITPPSFKSFADIGLNPMSTVPSRIVNFEDIGTGPMTPTINKSETKMTDAGLDPITLPSTGSETRVVDANADELKLKTRDKDAEPLMNRPQILSETDSLGESSQTSKRYPGYKLSEHMKWYANRYTAALEEMYQDLSVSFGDILKSKGLRKSATPPSKLDRLEAHSSSSSYSLDSPLSSRKLNALKAGPDQSRDHPAEIEADEQKQEEDTSTTSESDA